jgi:hypothetical protein
MRFVLRHKGKDLIGLFVPPELVLKDKRMLVNSPDGSDSPLRWTYTKFTAELMEF